MIAELEQAEQALGQGDLNGALESLLAAWRAGKSPEVAGAIDALSAKLSRPPIPAEGFQAAWMAVAGAGDAADVPRLLPGLLCKPLGPNLIERVRMMTMRPDDPRIAAGLVAMCEEPPATSQSIIGKLWGPVFTSLERMGDPRSRVGLEKRLKRPQEKALFWPQHYRKIEGLLAKLSAPPPAPAEAKKILAKIDKLIGSAKTASASSSPKKKKKAAGPDPLQAVYDDPHSVDARLVCADRLVELGDPRGELILLQHRILTGKANAADAKKVRELIKLNGDRFVPPELLPTLTPKEYTFHLGFLDQAEVIFESDEQATALVDHPAWRTLRGIDTDEIALLTRKDLELERFGTLDAPLLLAVRAARSSALSVTTLAPIPLPTCPPPELDELKRLKGTFDRVREALFFQSYQVGGGDFGKHDTWSSWKWLAEVPMFQKLERLRLSLKLSNSFEMAFDALPSLQSLECVDYQHLIELTRDGKMIVRMHYSQPYEEHLVRLAETIGQTAKSMKRELLVADALSTPSRKTTGTVARIAGGKDSPAHDRPSDNWSDVRESVVKRRQRFAKARKKR